MDKNKIKLIVCSQKLTIVSDDPPSYIYRVAEEVNNRVDNMIASNRYHPMISALILCSMQYCDEKIRLTEKNDELKEELSCLKRENEELKVKLKNEEEAHKKLQKDYKDLKNNKSTYHSNQRSFFDKSGNNSDNQSTNQNK